MLASYVPFAQSLCRIRSCCSSMDCSLPGSSVHETSLVAQMVKNFCVQFRRPGFNHWVRKIPPEKGMATHSSTHAWRIPWTEEPGRVAKKWI